MNDFHFLRPQFLFLFIPLAFLILALMRKKHPLGIWKKHIAKHLIPYVIKGNIQALKWQVTLLGVLLALIITALAGPSWEQVSLPLLEKKSGLVIALDLSPAMYAEDIKPSRLKRALYKINDLLKERHEGQTALIVYTDEAFVVTPLTDDVKTITQLLPSLDPSIMPSSGLRADKAIQKSKELLQQGGITQGSILLITAEPLNGIEKTDFPISILGVGTEQGAPIPKPQGGFLLDSNGGMIFSKLKKETLMQQAKSTGGKFTPITTDDSDIKYLLQDTQNLNDFEEKDSFTLQKGLDGGYWVILFAIPFAALLIRKGSYLTISLLVFSTNLQAFSLNDLWETKDRQAMHAFEEENYSKAAEQFDNPAWQAASFYKAQDFAQAAKLYAQDKTADGYYNLGNSLAKLNKFDDAIKAYNEALKTDPAHADAEYNKKLLEELKNEQEKDKQKGDESQDGEPQDGDSGEQDSNEAQDSQEGQDTDPTQDKSKGDGKEQESKNDNNEMSDQPQESKESEGLPEEDKNEYKDLIDKESETEDSSQKEQEMLLPQDDTPNEQQIFDDRMLERITDDPGALLRRKFQYQYKNQRGRS